jgi:hypothetical protein
VVADVTVFAPPGPPTAAAAPALVYVVAVVRNSAPPGAATGTPAPALT